jgi:hypothetical protein
VRGVRPNPQKLHAKVLDHDNGCYTVTYKPKVSGHLECACKCSPRRPPHSPQVTYKPEVSGQLEISISCDGIAISGSPFTADAVTLTSQPLHSPFTAPSQLPPQPMR